MQTGEQQQQQRHSFGCWGRCVPCWGLGGGEKGLLRHKQSEKEMAGEGDLVILFMGEQA